MKSSMVLSASAFLLACSGKEPTPASVPASPDAPVDAAVPEAPAELTIPELKKRKPFEIYSTCADVVTVLFGEDPRSPNAGRRTIAPSSSIEGVRNADGHQTVWLLDASGEPLVKVNVTRGMKRVEIGRSCRTLDAR